MDVINSFRGENGCLSNFYPVQVSYEGLVFHSAEAAFQAHKTRCVSVHRAFTTIISPGEAKQKGRALHLRADWENVKGGIMFAIVFEKFSKNTELLGRLCRTNPALLMEGNTWGDVEWGVCGGSGQNKLGKILMDVRYALISVYGLQ